jgi:glycosyltransferase involved in cell wall biosynthesis
MCALAHGRPVLACRGPSTDSELLTARGALALTPLGDVSAYARTAVELTVDPVRLRVLGEAGRRLYESRFDWGVVAGMVATELERISAQRAGAGRVVFVAHEVGGSGGMERQSERLVSGLLAAGRPVTVVARSCSLCERPGLRYVRVRTPRRPAALGYPAFFVMASVLLTGKRDGLLHTTGAIVANRAAVSTVHYCHRAAVTQVAGSRASRPGPLYRLNSALNGVLSLAGEAWCYRPERTRLLCAVSEGVASELRECFPDMAGAVRSVANGVDSTSFRPDGARRRHARAELELDDRARLALFVGGDWERKGLAYAVDALGAAPDWHLAVAGGGDPTSYLERAHRAGTQARLHFLGRVRDMARLYAGADAFVFPSAYEAFPLVALEAAASGLPLLITRVNGVEDLLHDGDNGWFILRDAADIARRLNQLAADPDLARSMGDAARRAAASYSWEAMADGYLSLYAELERRTPARALSEA